MSVDFQMHIINDLVVILDRAVLPTDQRVVVHGIAGIFYSLYLRVQSSEHYLIKLFCIIFYNYISVFY